MFFLYSLLYTLAFILMSPLFLLRREKYAAGFSERLGNYPEFKKDSRPVIWLHCVSVGEANAARPLVDQLLANFPDHRLVLSTTTRTGQELAKNIFKDKADAVFYFPFDWKFTVRRALSHFQLSIVLLMETEIWPRFFREASISGTKIAIVNGRLSEKSFHRYSFVKGFVRQVLGFIDLALMQGEKDAGRITSLGLDAEKVKITGNLKFDVALDEGETQVTDQFRQRFGIDGSVPLLVAASTHEPEERWILEALDGKLGQGLRLLIAPRHPERFKDITDLLTKSPYTFVRRSGPPSDKDKVANVILLDSIGELRAAYALADIVFVGGSLIPHGGQSVLEPVAAGKAIITGPYTHNFEAVIREFLSNNALIQLRVDPIETLAEQLYDAMDELLTDPTRRNALGSAALEVINANRGATQKTIEYLRPLISEN